MNFRVSICYHCTYILCRQVRSLLILACRIWGKKYHNGKRGHFVGKIDVFHYCSVGCTLNSRGDNDMGETFGFSRARLYVTSVPDSFGGQNFCRRLQISCLAMTSTSRPSTHIHSVLYSRRDELVTRSPHSRPVDINVWPPK